MLAKSIFQMCTLCTRKPTHYSPISNFSRISRIVSGYSVHPRPFATTPAIESMLSSNESSETPFSGEIPVNQLQIKYSKSGGPGGQHVNKVETKVEMRFNVQNASWIPNWIKPRLIEKEKNRITKDGFLIITSDKTRKQILNQADCLNRLRMMIFDATKKPKEPSAEELALKEKRKVRRAALILKEKRYHSQTKTLRGAQ